LAAVFLVAGLSLQLAARQSAAHQLPIQRQLETLESLHSSAAAVHDMLLYRLENQGRLDQARLAQVRGDLEDLLLLDTLQEEATPERLQRARRLAVALESDPGGAGLALLEVLNEISDEERRTYRALLDASARQGRDFRVLLLAMSLGLPLAGGASWLLYARHIQRPVRVLAALLRDFGSSNDSQRPLPDNIDPLVEPLYRNYESMVQRLQLLEAERDQRERQLEHRVREAASALLSQQQALNTKERLAATGELAAEMAHELKSPLAGMKLALTRLGRDPDLGAYRDKLEAIQREVNRATGMLNDLLARSRWSEEPPTDFDLSELVGGLVDLLSYQLPEEVDLIGANEAHQRVHLPEERTRHAVLNLLVNAIEVMREAGRSGVVEVKTQVSPTEVEIVVQDQGPGFPEQVLHDGVRAFATYRESGTGLGLVVVRRFAQDCGGRLELGNLESGGARVRLVLPQAASSQVSGSGLDA
jgi:signal transduction histidine kinase